MEVIRGLNHSIWQTVFQYFRMLMKRFHFHLREGVKDVKLHDLMTHEEKPESEMDEFDFED